MTIPDRPSWLPSCLGHPPNRNEPIPELRAEPAKETRSCQGAVKRRTGAQPRARPRRRNRDGDAWRGCPRSFYRSPFATVIGEGAKVRVIVAPEALATMQAFESEPFAEANVAADIAWATGHRFDS